MRSKPEMTEALRVFLCGKSVKERKAGAVSPGNLYRCDMIIMYEQIHAYRAERGTAGT
jgi:hypothetical protein